MNIVTDAILEKDEEDFLMNYISLGKAARNEFYESRLPEKNIQLLETIRKTRKITKKQCEEKEYDFAKETVKFLRHIDYVRLRDFDLKTLMGYGISPKRGLIQKSNKSELTPELRSMITKNIPTHLLPTDHHRDIIIDFMAYARKVSIKKQNLKTYFFHTFFRLFSSVSGAHSAFFSSHAIR